MAYDALHKGSAGVDYRTQISLQRPTASGANQSLPSDPAWDIYVGPLPFLLATTPERPYLRESISPRRERFDQSRDPGENSLDSGLWVRSQTSWHLGAGQAYAEPLEEDPDIARFRFHSSVGIDPWTKGQCSLLAATAQRDTGGRQCLGVPGIGVVVSTNTAGVHKYPTSGASTQLSTKTVTKLAANGTLWFALSASGLEYGALATGGEGATALANASALHWGKDRLWLAAGKAVYEITASPWTLPAATHTFRSGTVADIDSGAGGIYVMLNDAFTSLYVISVKDDATLNPPREVATLPRGEIGNFLYGYLGRYLVIGTNKGIRIADCSTGSALPIGPLIEVPGGVTDAVGDETFIWFTGGTTGVDPALDGSAYPALWRMNLASPVTSVSAYGDSAAATYAYATDLYAATTGQAYSVTTYEGQVFFVAGTSATNSPLWQESATALVTRGWLTSGQITYSTAERKTWASMSLEVVGEGGIGVEADTGSGFDGVTQTEIDVPMTTDLEIDTSIHEASGGLAHRVTLVGDGTAAGSPTLQSLALRATPSPRRTRLIRLPLWAMDHQLDRNAAPVGYEGFGYDRVSDLESLESVGGLIVVTDMRTGESVRAQIEKVGFAADDPPDRGYANYSGICTVTLLVV